MKSRRLWTALIVNLVVLSFGFAQYPSTSQLDSVSSTNYSEYNASYAVFGELGGNGISLSLNIEKYFSSVVGVRVGVGSIYGLGTSIPLMVNYYFGNRYKLELGAGMIFLPLWSHDAPFGRERAVLIGSTIGLKFQRVGGLMVRVSATPFYDSPNNQFRIFGGLSLGFAF